MSMTEFEVVGQFALCIAATVLYAHRLPKRDDFTLRAGIALMLAVIACVAAIMAGYTLYPTLTDDRSFFLAIGMFALVVVGLTLGVCVLWDATIWAALFCSSSGYLVQSIVFGLDRILHVTGIVNLSFLEEGSAPLPDVLALGGCSAVVLLAFWLLFAHQTKRSGLLGIRNPIMFFAVLVAMAVTLVLDLAIKDIMAYEMPHRYRIVLSAVYLVICIFVLVAEFEVIYNQALKANVALMEHTVAEQGRQYELSRETISAVNRRVHDIRHHVAGILAEGEADNEQLRQVLREVDVYDSAVKTGNAALDVVLSEKSLLCHNRGITFSCIADGGAVSFLPAPELYTLFGNALDLAIESVRELDDPARRSIALNVREQLGMSRISVEYHAGERAQQKDTLAFEALQQVVERHDGTLAISTRDNVLHLDVLLPLPE